MLCSRVAEARQCKLVTRASIPKWEQRDHHPTSFQAGADQCDQKQSTSLGLGLSIEGSMATHRHTGAISVGEQSSLCPLHCSLACQALAPIWIGSRFDTDVT